MLKHESPQAVYSHECFPPTLAHYLWHPSKSPALDSSGTHSFPDWSCFQDSMELLCLSRWLVTEAGEAAAVGSEANTLLFLLNLVACRLFTHCLSI